MVGWAAGVNFGGGQTLNIARALRYDLRHTESPMPSPLAITLDADQQERLEALASARHESVADIAVEAIAEYLAEDTAFRRAVEEGLAAGRAGEVTDFKAFAADLRRRMAVRSAE